MRNGTAVNEIKKLHLQEVVLFAMNHIPQADPRTLKLFLELVNAGGSFGAISHEEIMLKMQQVMRYVPNARATSLLILLDLLQIKPPARPALSGPGAEAKTGSKILFWGELFSEVNQVK